MPKPNPYFKYLGAEDRLQRAVMEYVYTAYPHTVMTHPMNEGKRSKFERFKMKYLMVSSGVPDILIFTPNNKYNGLAIELKTGYNKPTQNQKAWLNSLKTCDWYAIWLNNFDDCKLVIDQYFKKCAFVIVKYFIYYDEINQKVKRTPKRLQVVQNYYYMGQLTDVEYELLIEILFRAYGENDIMLEQFLLYFNELKEFIDRIDELIY